MSPALKKTYVSFIVGKSGKKLAKKVNANLPYFEALKKLPFQEKAVETKIRNAYLGLQKIYPKAEFADVYFAVGTFTSAGAFMNGTLVISIEMFPETSQTLEGTSTANFEALPAIVIHEVVHYQQKYSHPESLLAKSIQEGCADFITELVMDTHTMSSLHEYANPREEELWEEFQKVMNKSNFHNWLYTHDQDRTKDLGYWMGYKIVESYYLHHKDSPTVIEEILNIQDFNKFLADSQYSEKSKK